MSEEALRRILERVNRDEAFRDQLSSDPEAALEGEDLSPTEVVALTAGDEDALRRLAGLETVGFDLMGRQAEVTKNTVATYPDTWTKTKAAARGGLGGAGGAAAGGMPEVMGFCFGC